MNTVVPASAATRGGRSALRTGASAVTLALLLAAAPSAIAQEGVATPAPAPTPTGDAVGTPASDPASETITISTDATAEEPAGDDDGLPISASLTWASSIGVGTFVDGPQGRSQVVSTIAPGISWSFAEKMALSAGIGINWFHVVSVDSGSAYANRFLQSDTSLSVSHASIWGDSDLGLNLAGSFGVTFPTSDASQLQQRYFIGSITPALSLSYKVGPVSISLPVSMTKAFSSSSNPRRDACAKNPSFCPEGRSAGEINLFGTSTPIVAARGVTDGEAVIASAGFTSFSVSYGLSVGVSPVEGLSLGLAAGMSHGFGVVTQDIDDFSSENARGGRSQSDVLSWSASASYQVIKQLTIGLSYSHAAGALRPNGDPNIISATSRASDNTESLGLSLTASI